VGRGPGEIGLKPCWRKIQGNKACVAHKANDLAKQARERLKDADYWAEAIYKSPIAAAIGFKVLLPFLK